MAFFRNKAHWHIVAARPLTIIAVALALAGFGTYSLVAAATPSYSPITGIAGKCLDNQNGLKVSLNKIDLHTCNGTGAQQWAVNGTATTAGTIVNSNGYCLDVYHSGTAYGTLVDLHPCNGTGAQQWTVNSSTGAIVNPHSRLCLDDKYSNTADGNQIWMWGCNGTAAETWTVNGQTSPPPPPSNVTCHYQPDTWSGDASSVGYSVTKVSATDGNPASFSVKLNANPGTTEVVGYPSDQCLMYSALPANLSSSFNITPPAASSGLDYEYAYDIWLTTAANAQSFNWDNDLELMIWNYNNGQFPAGSLKGTLADGSKVYVAGDNVTGTVSVVLPSNETTGTVNVSSLVSQLQSKGYITSADNGILDLEYGIEAPYGGGQTFTVNSLSVAD